MSHADVAMEVRVGIRWSNGSARGDCDGCSANVVSTHRQPWSIIQIHLNRRATFADLSAILKARYGDWLMREISQEIDAPLLFFFRASDAKRVGLNPVQPIASPDSNFAPDRDVLLVQSHPAKPCFTGSPPLFLPHVEVAVNTLQEDVPKSVWGFLRSNTRSQKRIMDDPRDQSALEEGIRRSLETAMDSPPRVCLPQPYGGPNSFSPNSVAQMYAAQNSSSWPLYTIESDSKPAALPRPPQNDRSGQLVAQGSMSQYNLNGGQSACTAICVLAAVRILSTEGESVVEQMSSPVKLDAWVGEGVKLYRDVTGADLSGSYQQHASVDSIFEAAAFQDICKRVKRGTPFQGSVANRKNLIDAFQAAVDFGVEQSRLAITLTKSGETVLCVADRTDTEYRWFLFDSHGQSHEQKKLSYCKEYSTFHRLLDGFLAKYPFQDFEDDESIHSSMYNLFEALPFVMASNPPPSINSSTPTAVPNSQVIESSVAKISQSQEPSNSTVTPVPRGILDKSRYQCAISLEVMADPVVASDGHHYDRPEIEMHFAARRAAEMKRIAIEERRENGDASEESADATCCGGSRREIKLTSPKTGLKIDGTLTPVLLVEEMIVELVNENALGMTEEEIKDWRGRREEKKIRDDERRAQQEKADAEEEERRRHDAEAEERYGNRAPPMPVEPSHQVQVVRDINDDSEVLGERDLGICVALGDRRLRIPPTYANQDQRELRCMVACCAIPLSSNTWCDRCQRLVCDDCLSFGVSNFQSHSIERNSTPHRVCFECVTQVVDTMDSEDTLTRQRRAVILRKLERHLAFLTNRHSTKQAALIRHEMYDEFSQRLEEIGCTINSLTSHLNQLKEGVRREEQRANEAAADDCGSLNPDDELREISEQLASLEQQWHDLMQQDEPNDDNELLRYVCRRSELSHELKRLSDERMSLVLARSSAGSETPVQSSTQVEADMATSVRLRERLLELQRLATAEEESLEEQIARVTQRCEAATRLEELELSIAMAQSAAASSTPSRQTAHSSSKDALIQHLSTFQRTRSPLFPFRRHKRAALVRFVENLRSSNLGGERLGSILDQIVGLDLPFSPIINENISQLRQEITNASVNEPPASEDQSHRSGQSQRCEATDEPRDLLSEFVRLNQVDVSGLSVDDQIRHVERLSEIDTALKAMEEEFFQNQLEDVPDVDTAVQARRDIAAIGVQLESWPLPLGLQYPTQRMERQLDSLRSTLRLRGVESKRTFAEYLNNHYNVLVERREALEDEVAEATRLLRDAQTHAEEEVEQRNARAERRRQEEAARLAREQALREEEREAREADTELQRKHLADEEATRAAFANAGGEGGGGAFGMRGDARMCRRCRTGPLYNERCTDLAAHNDSYRDNEGRLRRPNECPNADCQWYNPNWHQWPYWDGIFGPH